MSKNYKGFTLAESLITLAVIGVVAAISIPPLMGNVQSSKTGAMLGRSIKDIENGCANVIQTANNNLSQSDDPEDNFMYEGYSSILIRHIDTNSNSNDTLTSTHGNLYSIAGSIMDISRVTDEEKENNSYDRLFDYRGIQSNTLNASNIYKNEQTGIYTGILTNPTINNQDNEDDPVTDIIFIDANGGSEPNRFGKDIFAFGLTDRCAMIPFGSARMNSAINISGLAENNCDNNSTNGITNGLSCTSRLIRNNFKFDY